MQKTNLYKTIFLLFIFEFILSCNNTNESSVRQDTTEIQIQLKQGLKTKTIDRDTLIVSETSAVIVIADSLQIDNRRKKMGEIFDTGADDYAFYLNETEKFLDSVKLRTIYCEAYKYLKFIYEDKREELINLKNLDELWKVYFFKPNKQSKFIDITTIEEEYKNYFK